MVTVSLQEFEAHVSEWMRRVQAGEMLRLERDGVEAGTVQPPAGSTPAQIRQTLADMRISRQQRSLAGLNVKELINAGRPWWRCFSPDDNGESKW